MKSTYEDYVMQTFKVQSITGAEANAVCPWHDDSAPSLRINIDSGLFLCHGCGRKGHLKKLAESEGKTIGQAEVNILDYVLEATSQTVVYERSLSEAYLTPLAMTTDYWTTVRKLSLPTVQRFQLGQDLQRNTATIPFRSWTGRLLGLIERQLGGTGPKYRYPTGFKKNLHLFGAWALTDGDDTVCLVEGPVDALALWDVGIPALALSGSSISERQIELLRRLDVRHVVIFTDADEAGTKAMNQIIDALEGTGILWSFARYAPSWPKDPAALTPKQRKMAFRHAASQLDITLG